MKKQPKPTKHNSVVFNQLCKLIPVGLGVQLGYRIWSYWAIEVFFKLLSHPVLGASWEGLSLNKNYPSGIRWVK